MAGVSPINGQWFELEFRLELSIIVLARDVQRFCKRVQHQMLLLFTLTPAPGCLYMRKLFQLTCHVARYFIVMKIMMIMQFIRPGLFIVMKIMMIM